MDKMTRNEQSTPLAARLRRLNAPMRLAAAAMLVAAVAGIFPFAAIHAEQPAETRTSDGTADPEYVPSASPITVIGEDKAAKGEADSYTWTSTTQYSVYGANSDGTLSRDPRAENWFRAKPDSDCGQAISALVPGDSVSIDGKKVTVEERTLWPASGYVEDVTSYVGDGKYVFTTESADGKNVWIVTAS